MPERNLPKDIAILIEDQSETLLRLEEQESQFRSRVIGLFGEDEKTKQFPLNGNEDISLQISRISKDEEKEERFVINLEVNLTSRKICTIAPVGTVLGKSQKPCCLDEILRLNRVLDHFLK